MSKDNRALVLVRGGGDLATGVALRLHRVGIKIVITELAQPLAVRRLVSFSEAVYEGSHTVEGVKARLVELDQLPAWNDAEGIPVLVDPDAEVLNDLQFLVVVDARLIKTPPSPLPVPVPLHIGLGPGFHAGRDCHAAIETRRSHTLGRVHWEGATQPDSGEPEGDPRRVLRAPGDGLLIAKAAIGDHVEEGQVLAVIQQNVILSRGAAKDLHQETKESSPSSQSDTQVVSPFRGVVRGLIRDGFRVTRGLKIGDVDSRDDPRACYLVSDKSLAVGGGVLEAILSRAEIRKMIFSAQDS